MAETLNIKSNTTSDNLEKENVNFDVELKQKLLPVLIIYGIFVLLGFLGNMMVCYIFGLRIANSVQNCLIVVLAGIDLFICAFIIPIDLSALYIYKNSLDNNNNSCKVFKFTDYICNGSSVAILNLIAYDRYRKICHPFKKQIKIHHLKWIFLPLFLFVCAGAFPAIFMHGHRNIGNLTLCDFDDSYHPRTTFIYFLVQFVLGNSLLLIFFSLYWKTSRELKRKLLRRQQTRKQVDEETSSPTSPSQSITDLSDDEIIQDLKKRKAASSCKQVSFLQSLNMSLLSWTDESSGINIPFKEMVKEKNDTLAYHTDKGSTKSKSSSGKDSNIATSSSSSKNRDATRKKTTKIFTTENQNKNQNKKFSLVLALNDAKSHQEAQLALAEYQESKERRATRIMTTVAVVGLICWIPHFITRLVESGLRYFDDEIDGTKELILMEALKRSYYFNSSANPIIYGMMNVKFRVEVINIFTGCTKGENEIETSKSSMNI